MLTAVVSDFHLGSTRGVDLARRPDVRARLLETVADADRIVLLGDVLELREQPLPRVLEIGAPLFRDLDEVAAGRPVVLVPGNHDHQLAEPWLERHRADDIQLAAEWVIEPADEGLAGALARLMPRAEVALAYPGLWLREDVYATHGHYLDCHLTIPRPEAIAASLVARLARQDGRPSSAAELEDAVSPLYAFSYRLAQASSQRALARSAGLTRSLWESLNPAQGRRRPSGVALGRVAIPAAVGALNLAGLGPFAPEISGSALRRDCLRAMTRVVEALGVEADHVIFGHTHRAGPLEGDDELEWTLPGGGRLWNTGSWVEESVLLHAGRTSPYWPGTVLLLRDEGPPELTNAFGDLDLRGPA